MPKSRISYLMKKASFTIKEAEKLGVNRRDLSRYVERGVLERIARGIYRNPQIETKAPFQIEDLLLTAQSVPQGVICLVSALSFYEMTDQIPRAHWIAVPNDRKAPKRPMTRIVRMRNMTLGKKPLKIGRIETFIFDRERCVVDAFRYLDKETAIKALKIYLQTTAEHRPDFKKLSAYARALRTKIHDYTMALTT